LIISKKYFLSRRYLVNASASQLSAYLEQLPEATRRRLAGDRVSSGGFHLMAGIERNGGFFET